MLRTRVVAVILAVTVLLCVPTFSASAENDETSEISVSFVGCGFVTANSTEYDDDFTEFYPTGESVTLTAAPDDGFEFLFWVNRENNKIVSRNASYTFYAATYALYEAVFDVIAANATASGWHTVIYLTTGDNIVYMNPVNLDDATYYNNVATSGMFVSGKTWVGWDKTPDEVAAAAGRVVVRPVYSTDVSFQVTSIINGVTQTQQAQYLSTLTLTALPRWDGKEFSYWIAHAKDVNSTDQITSFYATYQFVVTGDVTLEAVYGESYSLGISARIAGDFPSFNESSISIFAEHSVLRGYTVLQHGMLITKDLQIGSFPDTFVINPDEPLIFKRTANDTTLVGSYRVNIGNWTAETSGSYRYYPRIFARAYVIAKDANGVSHTVYSPIYCVDYVFDTGSSGGDNNDDPFS